MATGHSQITGHSRQLAALYSDTQWLQGTKFAWSQLATGHQTYESLVTVRELIQSGNWLQSGNWSQAGNWSHPGNWSQLGTGHW